MNELSSASDDSLDRARVLVLEDDPLNARLTVKLLQIVGVRQCTVCETGRDMDEYLAGSPEVDLILVDLRLPGENGYQIVRRIREQYPRLARAPVVAVTANVMTHDVAQAQAAGFDGFLGKPLNFDRFPDQLRRILAGQSVWEPR